MQQPIRSLPPSAFENLLLVTADPPAEVERQIEEMGIEGTSVGIIPITGSPVRYDGDLLTTEGIAPDDLTGLSMRFSTGLDALAPGHGWVLVDSLDVFLLYADEDRVVRFLDHVTAQTRKCDVRGVYSVVSDAIEEQTEARLRRSIDREIDLR